MSDDPKTDQIGVDFDDTEIKCLLLGDENERRKAGQEILASFGFRLMGRLREFFWLSDDEKASVIHDTILEIIKKAEEATLDVDAPLVRLLLVVCRNNAIDLSRKKGRRPGRDEELTEEIAGALEDTSVGQAWKQATSNEDCAQIRKEFHAFAQTLPPQQKLVAGIMADNLAFTLSQDEIARKIYESTGKTVSRLAIKGVLSQIRQKFKTVLKKKYPDLPI